MQLKHYQENTLNAVAKFLKLARRGDVASAFVQVQDAKGYSAKYHDISGLEGVPYICTRVPTGGGKTLMAAYTIGIAADNYIESEHPVVLWMVPTDVIRRQTLETLKNKNHPNFKALQDRFGDDLRVFDITEFAQYRRQDMTDNTCIFVATFASLRITNTDGRKVYAHNEAFEPHFASIPDKPYLEHDENGKVKFSFANVLAFLRPLVLVDEAHNNKSKLSRETLLRIRPSAIIEFTATPDAKTSNVLYKVSAAELKAEDMVKLPISLTENLNYQETITAAVQKRTALEELAAKDDKYIRPIVLYQAETKDKEFNVSFLKEYLVKEENIEDKYIAVATGEQKELDGINLFDPSCQIRHIITVEALKEGWDCSFAYVLCSVAKVRSSTAAEQFLGRIMRMPYVERRKNPELNKAYSFVNVDSWHESVAKIRDNLVDMGFDDSEADSNIDYNPPPIPKHFTKQTVKFIVKERPPEFEKIFWANDSKVTEKDDGTFEVSYTAETEKEAVELLSYAQDIFKNSEDIAAVHAALSSIKEMPSLPKVKTPSQRGEKFSVDMLCLDFGDGEPLPVDKDTFLGDGFRILDTSSDLENFYYDDRTKTYEFDVDGKHLREKFVADDASSVLFSSDWTDSELISWINRKVRQEDVSYPVMNEYVRRVLKYLENQKAITLSQLVRLRYQLVAAIEDKIKMNRQTAVDQSFEQLLFAEPRDKRLCLASPVMYDNDNYPAKSFYTGSYDFQKHFYPSIGAMDDPEEEKCAKVIDRCAKVKYWVRNIDRQPDYSFWIQTSTDKFYPDFVAKLTDGRTLIVEHKGAHLYSNDDSKEKRDLGQLWQDLSNGKGLFIMTRVTDDKGRSIEQQINDLIGK